jgi:dTDP-4-amino-4,6-dideoxygalactose transaminase
MPVPAVVRSDDASWKLAVDGGSKVRDLAWPSYDKGNVELGLDDEAAALRAVRSKRLFRYDNRPYASTEVGQLEIELGRFFDCKYALACASGTTAIALGLLSVGVKPGDTVACPAFTFAATPSAIVLAGAKPLIIDVDENLHMDPDDLAARLTPDVRAVVAVHMRGFASDMAALAAVADAHGIPVIEDAVPALGVALNGRQLGTFGKVGAFSTQSDKSINTGEGGFLITSDRDVYARAIVLTGAYEKRLYQHIPEETAGLCDLDLPIFSFRMDEIRGAIARQQLQRLGATVETYQRNYDYVVAQIADLAEIKIRRPVAPKAYLGESLIFRIPDADDAQLSWFLRALTAEGIDARHLGDRGSPNVRCFWNWRFNFPGLSAEDVMALRPRSAGYLREVIDVPMSITLSRADCDDLATALRKVCRGYVEKYGHRVAVAS